MWQRSCSRSPTSTGRWKVTWHAPAQDSLLGESALKCLKLYFLWRAPTSVSLLLRTHLKTGRSLLPSSRMHEEVHALTTCHCLLCVHVYCPCCSCASDQGELADSPPRTERTGASTLQMCRRMRRPAQTHAASGTRRRRARSCSSPARQTPMFSPCFSRSTMRVLITCDQPEMPSCGWQTKMSSCLLYG